MAGQGPLVDNRDTALVLTSAFLTGFTGLALFMRLAMRWGRSGMGMDDILISISWVLGLCLNMTTLLAAKRYGLGRHTGDIPDEDWSPLKRCNLAISAIFPVAITTAKASFALLYLRIFESRKMDILNKCLIAFLFTQALVEDVVVLSSCRPFESHFYINSKGYCLSLKPLYICGFVFNLSTDLILFVQPIPSMWKLQLPIVKRIGLIAMLSLGLLVCAISIFRIVSALRIHEDTTYDTAESLTWSMVEISSLIFCSCIPSLRQAIARVPFLNRMLGLSSGKDSRNYYQQYPHTGGKATGRSIQLRSQSRNRHKGTLRPGQFGTVSRAEAGTRVNNIATARPESANGSTDEIFPHKEENGGIVVTHEVKTDVESHSSQGGTGRSNAEFHEEEIIGIFASQDHPQRR